MSSPEQKRRMTLRGAVAAILAVASPRRSSPPLIQNFMTADIQAVAACFTKVEGSDATTYTRPSPTRTPTWTPPARSPPTASTAAGRGDREGLTTATHHLHRRRPLPEQLRQRPVRAVDPGERRGRQPPRRELGHGVRPRRTTSVTCRWPSGDPANGGTDLVTNWTARRSSSTATPTWSTPGPGSVVITPGEEIISAYRIDVSDGSQGTTGTLRYTAVATVQ